METVDNIPSVVEAGVGGGGYELLMLQFDFHPIHHMYSYIDGIIPARTIVVLEINLPSGIKADMVDMKIDEYGNSVQLEMQ